MKIYLKQTVYEAAIERISWIFDEFPKLAVNVSGGKDSTVIFHLALEVARRKNRLPLEVMFLDQEAEWEATIDMIRSMMTNPDVRPRWHQMPIRLFNATSSTEHWLNCWDPKDEERSDASARIVRDYGEHLRDDRFKELFNAIPKGDHPNEKFCYMAGVRTEESPGRFIGLTESHTYKGATYGRVLSSERQHYTFYPIYDWSYTDVWKAIHENGWPYNKIYDAQYAYGIPINAMRVSNVHHETAVQSLFYMQELEPETYERLTQRIAGIDMAGKFGKRDYWVSELPFMFKDWREYRDYLLEKLIDNEKWREGFRRTFARHDKMYLGEFTETTLCKLHVQSILTNDWEGIKMTNWERAPQQYAVRLRMAREKKELDEQRTTGAL